MSPEDTRLTERREEQLDKIVAAFFEDVESGIPVDPEEWIARHEQFAPELRKFFANRNSLERLAGPLRAIVRPAETLDHARQLGDFRILREIGRGGMGVVYEAEQLSLGRKVALKVLPFAAVLDKRQLQRFKNEAQAAAVLKHPHIVGVHCVGCERGVHFYAMELVEGHSLAQVIEQLRERSNKGSDQAEHPISPSMADAETQPIAALSTEGDTSSPGYFRSIARLGIQAAEALEYAHQLGIVHRDIKPSNLMVEPGGHLWITDFGLAQVQSDNNLTMTGDLLGTLRYMSPEQASGRRAILDHRTDIYSLGITLYELATLTPAFAEKERAKLLHHILEDEPRSLHSINSAIPRDLETIILKAIAKEPAARYDSSQELADDLNRFLDQKPILARRSTRRERLSRWCRRNPVIATLAAGLLLALSIGLVGSTSQWFRAETQWSRAERAVVALSEKVEENRRQLYFQGMHGAYEAWKAGNVARVETLLLAQIPEPGEEDLREFTWRHLWHLLNESKRNRIFSGEAPIQCLAATSDGAWLAWGLNDGTIALRHHTTGQTQQINASTSPVMALAFAYDGHSLISASSDGTVQRWDVQAGSSAGPAMAHDTAVMSLAHCQVAPLIVTGEKSGRMCVWDIESGTLLRDVGAHAQPVACVAFSADGQRIVSGSSDHTVVIWDAASLAPLATVEADRGFVEDLAFASGRNALVIGGAEGVKIWDLDVLTEPSGVQRLDAITYALAVINDRVVAIATDRNTVGLWDIQSGYPLVEWPGHLDRVQALAFAPGTNTLYSTGRDGSIRAWDVTEAINESAPASPNDIHWVGGLDFSNDGSRVIVGTRHEWRADVGDAEGVVEILDAATAEVVTSFAAPLGRRDCVAWSPVGPWVATCGQGAVAIWDVMTGSPRLAVSDEPMYFTATAWSPDGRLLAAGGSTDRANDGCPFFAIWRLNHSATSAHEVYRFVGDDAKWFVSSLAFSPGGESLAIGMGNWVRGEAQLWRRDQQQWRQTGTTFAKHSGNVWAVAFSADGALVASAGGDRRVNVWSMSEDRILYRLNGFADVYALAISPDGRTLAAGVPRYIHFWDLHGGEELGVLSAWPWIRSLKFSPDGMTIAWAGADRRIHFLRSERFD